MLGFLLTSHALSKVIETPGSFSDQVQAKLELTFSSVENYDSIVIFPTPEKFTVNKQTLKRIYYNPETLVIESDNNVLDYSLIRLKKGYCTTLDFILNKYENESVPISFNAYDYKSKHICIVFANSHETKSVVYGNNDKLSGKIYAYDNYILDGTSYRELKKNTDLELTYTTFMIDYITENISFNSFGINKGKKETYLDRYYIIDFETVLRGYLVLHEIKDFKYGMYDINVNGSYALVVPARSYMFILKYENYSIDAFSGTYQHKVPYNVNHDIVAWSFVDDSYFRIKGNDNIKFLIAKNSTEMKCKEIITMFSSISYKLDGGKQAQYCVFAVTNDGNIKVEDNKVSTYYDANGNKLAETKD